jgi:hypothetical protein
MKRHRWKVKSQHADITEAFPFAVVDSKGVAVALVKTRGDAQFIAEAARTISGLESDSSRNRALYLGASITRRN